MNQILDITLTSRKIVLQFLDGYTLAQLNTIPQGFNNNLIWNIGHIIVTQQVLVYQLSGLPMMVLAEMVEKYKKGTKPENLATQVEVATLKHLLFETINQTKIDAENKIFKTFTEYPTSTGYTLKSAQDAMVFNDFHEGLHIGVMMSIKKFI